MYAYHLVYHSWGSGLHVQILIRLGRSCVNHHALLCGSYKNVAVDSANVPRPPTEIGRME
jgi:hypothetical protein